MSEALETLKVEPTRDSQRLNADLCDALLTPRSREEMARLLLTGPKPVSQNTAPI